MWGDRDAFTAGGLRFHLKVVEASHNRALIAYAQALIEVLHEAYAPQTEPELARRVLAKHRRVYGYIAARDGARASETMTEHLREVRIRVLDEIRRTGPGAAGMHAANA